MLRGMVEMMLSGDTWWEIVVCFPSRSAEIVVFADIVDIKRAVWPAQRLWPSGALPIPLWGIGSGHSCLLYHLLSIFFCSC